MITDPQASRLTYGDDCEDSGPHNSEASNDVEWFEGGNEDNQHSQEKAPQETNTEVTKQKKPRK